jgi:hypothetical protein
MLEHVDNTRFQQFKVTTPWQSTLKWIIMTVASNQVDQHDSQVTMPRATGK